ncbi:hypothetical protein Tco_1015612 [Tanacetum coccineum]|uniref:Uncharacterized protein n=1 Tax=Tanacetum coccineum TaxID=301880 RepID=A0ABQ5FNS0_9ASTR
MNTINKALIPSHSTSPSHRSTKRRLKLQKAEELHHKSKGEVTLLTFCINHSYNESNIMGEVDINTLTMELYMALTRGNEAPGVVKPGIGVVTHDAFMLCVFPIILIGAAKRGAHLEKKCPLNEEVNSVKEVNYGEFGRSPPFNSGNEAKYYVGPPGYYTCVDNRPPFCEKRFSLEEFMTKHLEESARRRAEMEE